MTGDSRGRREFWIAQRENLRIAVDALRANKLRSVLTVIGNVVAVMSVIAVVSIIDGLNTYVTDKVLEQGLGVLTIDKYGFIQTEDEWREAQKRRDLTLDDAMALEARMSLAERVVAQSTGRKGVRFGKTELQGVDVVGTTAGYEDVSKVEVAQGRHLDENDVERRRPVCLIGSQIAEHFFARRDPLNESIRVGGYELRVVGVMEERGSVLGTSRDNVVILPLGQYYRMFGSRADLSILVKAKSGVATERAEDEARVILRAQRHVPIVDTVDLYDEAVAMRLQVVDVERHPLTRPLDEPRTIVGQVRRWIGIRDHVQPAFDSERRAEATDHHHVGYSKLRQREQPRPRHRPVRARA